MANKSKTYGTVEHFITSRWGDINKRTVNGSAPSKSASAKWYRDNGIRLEMTRNEFSAWVKTQEQLINSIYLTGDTPSIDRKNTFDHYSIDNLRIIPYRVNCATKGRSNWIDKKTGKSREDLGTYCIVCNTLLKRLTFPSGVRECFKRLARKKFCSRSCRMKGNTYGAKVR